MHAASFVKWLNCSKRFSARADVKRPWSTLARPTEDLIAYDGDDDDYVVFECIEYSRTDDIAYRNLQLSIGFTCDTDK